MQCCSAFIRALHCAGGSLEMVEPHWRKIMIFNAPMVECSSKVLTKYWKEDSDVYSFLTVLSIEYDVRVKPKEKCFTVLCVMRLRGERGHAMVPSRPRATASNYSTPHTLLFTRVFYLYWYLYFVYLLLNVFTLLLLIYNLRPFS